MNADAKTNHEIIYIGDPMCSWCWGFAPVLDEILTRHGQHAGLKIIVGGLRPGTASPMDEPTKSAIRSHWEHVNKASGQPFDYAFFDRDGFVYDTEPAARAVVVVRNMAPAKEFSFFKALQEAFYSRNEDITRDVTYLPILRSEGIDETEFYERFDTDEMRSETLQDFSQSRELGIRGFPSVVLRNGEKSALLTGGYQSFENLDAPVSRFFANDPTDDR